MYVKLITIKWLHILSTIETPLKWQYMEYFLSILLCDVILEKKNLISKITSNKFCPVIDEVFIVQLVSQDNGLGRSTTDW